MLIKMIPRFVAGDLMLLARGAMYRLNSLEKLFGSSTKTPVLLKLRLRKLE